MAGDTVASPNFDRRHTDSLCSELCAASKARSSIVMGNYKLVVFFVLLVAAGAPTTSK
jgi:hypothetical protein